MDQYFSLALNTGAWLKISPRIHRWERLTMQVNKFLRGRLFQCEAVVLQHPPTSVLCIYSVRSDLLTSTGDAAEECRLAAEAIINVNNEKHAHHHRRSARLIQAALVTPQTDHTNETVHAISKDGFPDLVGIPRATSTKVTATYRTPLFLGGADVSKMVLHCYKKGRRQDVQMSMAGLSPKEQETLKNDLCPHRDRKLYLDVTEQESGLAVVYGQQVLDQLQSPPES